MYDDTDMRSGGQSVSNDGDTLQDAPVDVGDLLLKPSMGGRTLEVTAGRILFEPETPARHVYFIRGGQVRVYQVGPDDSARLVEILGRGDWFGSEALSREGVYTTRAVAVTAGAVIEAPADRLLTGLVEQPGASAKLIGDLAAKLQAARADAACLVFDDCNSRLVRTLLHFSRSAAASPTDEGVVLRITHQQLAQAVGAARETVSLALTQLRQRNLLRTGRNQLFFNPQALENFCRRVTPIESEMQDERVA